MPRARQHAVWSTPLVRHENVGAAHGAQIMRSVTSAIPDRDGSHSLSTHLVTNRDFLSFQVLMVGVDQMISSGFLHHIAHKLFR